MKSFLFAVCVAAFVFTPRAWAAEPQMIPLWNGVAPGSETWTYAEESSLSAVDNTLSISNVVRPTLSVHLPAPGTSTGTAVIVIPGGGFQNLAYGKEGDTVAQWLNSIGVTAFVLKYRTARTGDSTTDDQATRDARTRAVVPLAAADAKQALQIVRSRAAEWGVRPDRIGVMGFSAGGYLAICLGSDYESATRPDFVAAIYPGSPPDLKVPADAPPIFLTVAADDPYVSRDSFGAFNAWKKAGGSVELHVYAKGGHGFALRKQGLPVNGWDGRFKEWLDWLGYLNRKS